MFRYHSEIRRYFVFPLSAGSSSPYEHCAAMQVLASTLPERVYSFVGVLFYMMNILEYCQSYPKRAFDAGEVVLSEGTQTGVIYILVDGAVEVAKQGVKLARVSEPGSVLGEVSALLGTPHMASVKAVEPTRFYVVSDAPGFIRSNTEVGFLLATILAQRLSTVTNSLTTVKRTVDSLIQQQTARKSMHAARGRENSFVGVLSVGAFQKGTGIVTPGA